jgi:hypothetical protein
MQSRKASNSKKLWSSLIKHKKAKKLIIRSLSNKDTKKELKEFKVIVQKLR